MKIDLIEKFAQLKPNATFACVKNYKNAKGEVSDFGINFHINYENALKNSKEIVEKFVPENEVEEKAKAELLTSLTNRIQKFQTDETEEKTFLSFQDADGKTIKGVKCHKETGEIYMFGSLVWKRTITAVPYKKVNSSALTLAKQKIESLTPVSKFRSFKLKDNFEEIAVQNTHIK